MLPSDLLDILQAAVEISVVSDNAVRPQFSATEACPANKQKDFLEASYSKLIQEDSDPGCKTLKFDRWVSCPYQYHCGKLEKSVEFVKNLTDGGPTPSSAPRGVQLTSPPKMPKRGIKDKDG